MGIDLLSGVREKILRAGDHLDAFQSEVGRYEAKDPYSVVRQFEDHIPEKSGRPGLTWRARVDPPPPGLWLGVIAGDCVHNLRSALEHLAWALVLQNGGEPNDDTGFPIFHNGVTSKGQPRTITIRAASGGANSAAETILEMLQPYNGGNDPALHPLWILRKLSNTDKHQVLNIVVCDFGRMVMERSDGARVSATRSDVEDGIMITWILTEHPDFDPDMEMETHFTPEIAFRDTRGVGPDPAVPALDLLSKLLEFVREGVVQRFARACFGGELTF